MSKMGRMESDTDANVVTILRKHQAPVRTLRSQAELNAAARQGVPLETSKKFAAGSNRQHKSDKNTMKLDEETEVLHHDRVPLELGKIVQQARAAKEWTQKELSTHINEKVEVIREYENGKAIPNQQTLNKMERALGIRLRGKEMGKPLPVKNPK